MVISQEGTTAATVQLIKPPNAHISRGLKEIVSKPKKITITSKDGVRATAQMPENTQGNGKTNLLAQTETGRQFFVPLQMLQKEKGNHYFLPVNLSHMDSIALDSESSDALNRHSLLVLPVIAEEAEVQKRTVESGRVRLSKRVHEREEEVTTPLQHEEVQVERISINRYIDNPAEVRQEGEATIIPVMKEILVVEKRILLVEEVRVTRRQKTENHTQTVNLREEEVLVERSNSNKKRREQ